MSKGDSIVESDRNKLKEKLVGIAGKKIAEGGLSSLTLRDLTAGAGKSTMVVTSLFGDRAGLVEAVVRYARLEDQAFHEVFFEQIRGLDISGDAFADVLLRYIYQRAAPRQECVRIWQACVAEPFNEPSITPLFTQWRLDIAVSWRDWLKSTPFEALGDILPDFLLMEEMYTAALHGKAEYDFLLSETIRALISGVVDSRPTICSPATNWVERRLPPPVPLLPDENGKNVRRILLDATADIIVEAGIGGVTNRSVAKRADVSPSTLIYQFGSMETLLVEAIYHTLLRHLPAYLNYTEPLDVPKPVLLDDWASVMTETLLISDQNGVKKTGYYVAYARLAAQICKRAHMNPELKSLAMTLRAIEGSGTFYGGQKIWPEDFNMTRLSASHFAIWIKGFALSLGPVEAVSDKNLIHSQLKRAAITLVWRPKN